MLRTSSLCQIYGAQPNLVLRAGEAERLRPEETVDPILHRFVNHLATLAVDREAPVPAPDEDPWVSTVLEPRWDVMPAARDALAGVAAHFTMTPAVRNPWKAPESTFHAEGPTEPRGRLAALQSQQAALPSCFQY